MDFSLQNLRAKLSDVWGSLNSAAPSKTNGADQTTEPSFWQRNALNFGSSQPNSNSTNNQVLRQLAQNVDTWRSDGDEKKTSPQPAPKTIIIPLKDGKKQAGYDDLSRRTTLAALEQNGIHPSNIEMEELMALPASKNLDMNGYLDENWNFHDKPGLMPEAVVAKDINGNYVSGYKQTFSPKFQKSVIDDLNKIKGDLALTPDKKAVVDMSMNERLIETVKIAYDKGYISQEVKEKLGNLSPGELVAAFAAGGVVAVAATSAEASAVIGPFGIVAGEVYIGVQALELDTIAKGAAKATNREQLDQPAKQFGQWMGNLSKDGVLMLAGMAGGATASRTMPKVEKALDAMYGSIKNVAAGESNLKLPILGLPEPVPAGHGIPGKRLPVPVSPAPDGGRPILVKPNDSVLAGAPNVVVGKTEVLESRAVKAKESSAPRRNIQDHEGVSGVVEGKQVGHTLLKHVGKSEKWLQNRLVKETTTPSASSFHNETVGNRTIGKFKKQYETEINQWLDGGKNEFQATMDMGEDIGLVVNRSKKGTPLGAEQATKATVRLVKDNSEHGWHLFTVKLQK